MLEISLNKINKSYGFNDALKDLSFDIKTGEKIAIIGSNGSGKTTTLRIIMGKEIPDSGSVNIRKGSTIGYLEQIPKLEDDNITANEVYLRGIKNIIDLENKINSFIDKMDHSDRSIKELDKLQEEYRIKGGYQLKEKIEKIKHGFKLSNSLLETNYNSLSGGEKTIVNLASLVLSSPDILLLDEPTNHLDIDTLEWFEEYLNGYKGTVLIVSHDRYFIDRVVNKIISIEKGKSEIYFGNYTYYQKESEKRFLLEFQKYKNQQKEIKALKEAILRLKEWGTKSDNPMLFRRMHAIEKRLERLELIEKPKTKTDLSINLSINDRSANHVLTIKDLDLNIGDRVLLKKANMGVYYKERVCLMGRNGTGKTTLIKNIINNTHEQIKLGANVEIGYISQEIRFDNDELSIYEYIRNFFSGSESELRSKLHQFYFDENCIDKKIKNISGGEKVRIKLLELILKKANFLILDEPTNHIDIDTKEVLENALLDFDGTILFISHDRYFINKICTKIVRIENYKLVEYIGNYDSIKKTNNNVTDIKEVNKITINGSNRLKEFLSDANKIELVNDNVYRIKKRSKTFYLKIANHLSQESIRLDYLSDKISIPEKVFYEKYNNKSYILTKEVKGISLADSYYVNNPIDGINIIVESFNNLYNVDYSDCIIDETIDVKIKRIEDNIKNINDIDEYILNRFCTKDNIIKYLKGNKPKQIIGFTHGNLTLSNIISLNNQFNGFIDVRNAGLCDIYYDLVVCEMSIEKIYGKEYVDIFYNKLGIEKDSFKSEYYRILYYLHEKSYFFKK